MNRIVVPGKLAAFHERFHREAGRAWIADLPRLAASYLDRWQLTRDGEAMHGMVALVLPVRRADGVPAALKLQPHDPEHLGEEIALRAWNGDAAVHLLAEDVPAGSTAMVLERLIPRDLLSIADAEEAVSVIGGLLARLHRHTAPAGITPLAEVAARMVADTPIRAAKLRTDEGRLLQRWADRVAELLPDGGDRLLHWDLHFENVLAAEREPWLAIDPKPLAGDPGFDLLPVLHNRWEEAVATGDPARVARRRFDLLVEILELDRERAVGWTLGRTLQNSLWDIEDGESTLNPAQVLIARAVQ